jgi:hypothetical protein
MLCSSVYFISTICMGIVSALKGTRAPVRSAGVCDGAETGADCAGLLWERLYAVFLAGAVIACLAAAAC